MINTAFAIPGDISLPTGGYIYDRRVLALLAGFGVAAAHVELPASFPEPDAADLAATADLLSAVPPATPLVVDGLAYGAMPADVIERVRGPIVALVHLPLCLAAGLTDERRRALHDLEKTALAMAAQVIVTSATTARTLASDFDVPPDSITLAEPGTDPSPRAHGGGGVPQLLAVGSIVPGKAYDLLVQALAPLDGIEWQLTIAGATDRSPEALAALRDALRTTGLSRRVTVAGPMGPARLAELYASADVFVHPSRYESYGMVLAEAMACGLPIVCTTGGAPAEMVPDGAAVKVAPGDQDALREAVRGVLTDDALRRTMADASWDAGQKLPRWEDTARTIARVVADVA